MSKSIEQIIHDYNNGAYSMDFSEFSVHTYPLDHVFDIDKSVRWNRDEVERQNKLAEEARKAKRDKADRLMKQLRSDVTEYISECLIDNDPNYNRDKNYAIAQRIEEQLFDDYHSNMYSYLEHVDKILEYILIYIRGV